MKSLKTLLILLAITLPMTILGQTVYDFDLGNGLNQMTLGTGSTANVVTSPFLDNTTNVLNLTTGGQSCVASLNAFTGATDCQVVWKQYYTDLFTSETKAGIVLRSTNRTSTYATGLKTGYYLFVHANQFGGNAGKATFRLMKVTTTNVVSLYSSSPTTITGYTANTPLWLQAKISGNVITMDYSTNGTSWTNSISYTDVANTFPNAGTVQAFWGLGAVMTNVCYLDNITITNQDVAKVSLIGNNKYVNNGTAQGPSNATTARFTGTPVVTYTYSGIGATVYSASATKPTDEGTYLVTASATDGTSTATDQMAFDILPPFSSYTFNNEAVGSTTNNISFQRSQCGAAVIENYSTGTSNGYKTVAKMFKPNTAGSLSQTYVADLNSITTSTNYSITWKQYITATGQKRGFLLCAQNATTVDGGTTSIDTSNYAVGLKKGYLFLVFDNGTANVEMRIYKSVYNAITNLYVVNNKSVPTATTIGAARWYRASVSSGSQKFEYSNDGKTWVLASEGVDATYQPIAGKKIQAVGGLGGFSNCVYYDYIGYTDNTASPKVQLNGTSVYAYNGSSQSPVAIATGFTSPVITYSYTGSGSTTYGPTATAPTSAGSYAVTANANDGVANVTSSAFIYTISKANPSISVAGTQSLTYLGVGQGPSTISYTGDGVTSLAYSSTDGAEYAAAVPPTSIGSYQVRASAAAGTFYNVAASDYYTFNISPKSISVSDVVVANKIFDNTATATFTSTGAYSGLVNSEVFPIAGTPAAVFADAVIGNGKAVTVTGYAAPSSNYTLTGQPTGLTASIYPAVSTFSKVGSSNWSTATEWTYSPLAGTDLVIQKGELVVDQNTTVKSITVQPGAKLTLNNGFTLTSTQSITLQNDASGMGTFVNNGGTLTTGNASVGLYLASGRNWLLSSPVSDATSAVFDAANSLSNNVSYYNEANNTWPQITNNTTALTVGKGYIANTTVSKDLTFTGTLNDGNKAIELTRTTGDFAGYNMIGNPYPSYLDWSAAAAANPDVMSTIWYRTRTSSQIYLFETYNATGNVSSTNGQTMVTKLIPPMQAFWVNATAPTTLNLTNAMRFHADNVGNKLKSLSTDRQLLRLKVSNGTNSDETVVYTDAQAANEFDRYDSPKMFNNNVLLPEIYTTVGTEKLVINGLSEFKEGMEIPVAFKTATAGTYTLQIGNESTLNSDMSVILKDKVSNKLYNLTMDNTYTFTSDASDGTDRFVLILKSSNNTTGLLKTAENVSVEALCNESKQIEVSFSGKPSSDASIRVFNTIGQLLSNKKLENQRSVVYNPTTSGVYILSITNAGKTVNKKVLVN
jgi:hypothetical protein